jgi:competence protein ComEC
MKRPLVSVAVCYAAGILLAGKLEPSPALCLGLGISLLLLALAWPRVRLPVLALLFISLGAASFVLRIQPLERNDLRNLVPPEAQIVTVKGRLSDPPELRVYSLQGEQTESTMARVKVSALARNGVWQSAVGEVLVTCPANLEGRFFAGQTVELTGVLAPPCGPRAPGLFDYRAHLANQGVYFMLRLDSATDWRLAAENTVHVAGFSERFIRWAKATLARGLPLDESVRLQWAMVLGWKAALTDEVSEPFMRSGTIHIFAISGLHIALIAGILIQLAVLVRIPRRWCFVPVLLLIWFYTVATGLQSSAIRSSIMMSVILLAWALNRPPDLLNSLFIAALVIFIWDPLQLFQASFQLSFCVVLGIAVLLPPVEAWCRKWFEPDPLLPRDLRPRWRKFMDPAALWLMKAIAISFAAWLGSLPLTAGYFHLFTPGSLLANLIIVPLSSAALAAAMGGLACGEWLPWCGELFNHAGWILMQWMNGLSHWFAGLSGAAYHVPSPTLLEMLLFYAVVFPIGLGWLKRHRERWLVFAAAVVLVTSLGLRIYDERQFTRITILPLNGGHALQVDAPGRSRDLLIDCGSTNTFEFTLRPFLHAAGVNQLPRLTLTHGDLRHIGAAPAVLHEFAVQELFTGQTPFRSPAYRQLLQWLETRPDLHRPVKPGDLVSDWKVLHPPPGSRFSQADDGALVLLGEIRGLRLLLVSDLGRDGQELLLGHDTNLVADVVVTGLPSRGEPLNDSLIAAIRPKLIVVADTETPATEQAPARLLERLKNHGIPVFSTRVTGAIVLELRSDRAELRAMNGATLRVR